jgi:hypothetical protein
MSQPEDPRLSEFLRRYRPCPPSTQGNFEDYLFDRIEQNTQAQSKGVYWIFSTAILAGVVLGWGMYRYSNQPELAASAPEIENFVLENWNRESIDAVYTANDPLWGNYFPTTSQIKQRHQLIRAR